MRHDYLERILTARVYDVAAETPLEKAANLSARIHNQIFLKREDTQQVFSFKLRGAYNKMAKLSPAALKRGVIAASAGNHAQGVALAAQKLGSSATIVMPSTTPQIKINAVMALGATVLLHGDSYNDAYEHALTIAQQKKTTFVHPYDDPDVIAGQGTIGMEILRQHGAGIHAIFVPIGGGGLIAGIAAYVKRLYPSVKIIGVEPIDSDAMYRSLKRGGALDFPKWGCLQTVWQLGMLARKHFGCVRSLLMKYYWLTLILFVPRLKMFSKIRERSLNPLGRYQSLDLNNMLHVRSCYINH